MKILVVDDEKLIREVIIEYLKLENYDYLEASNGIDAINLVKHNDIDIIIMDIMMPKMDGFLASSEIKKISDAPIIMLSARDTELDKLNGFDIGIDDYITKPFSPKELIARIKAIAKRINIDNDLFIYEDLKIDYKAHSVFIKDKETEEDILNLLISLADKDNKCVIIISHSNKAKEKVDIVYYLVNGKIKVTN